MKLATKIKCLKCLVYIYLGVLLVITGALQIIVGGGLVWLHLRYTPVLDSQFFKPALFLLLLGPIVFVLCWFGWNATAKKNRVHLGLFTVGLVLVIILQFIIIGWTISMRESLPNTAEFTVNNAFNSFLRDQSKELWDRIQSEVQCCGVYGVIDYRRAANPIPHTCCSTGDDPKDPYCKHVYQRGCLEALSSDTRQNLLICGLVALTSAIIQSFGIFCIVQLTFLLGRKASFDLESEVAPAPETRPKAELMPLAAAAAAVAKQKSAPPIPAPIPKVPSPMSDKKYKPTVSLVRKESNGC